MSHDRAATIIPHHAIPAIMDAIQLAVVDRRASKVTRKAAFSALLALVEAGFIIGDTSTISTPSDGNSPAKTGVSQTLGLTG
jgi:hypothetical protein